MFKDKIVSFLHYILQEEYLHLNNYTLNITTHSGLFPGAFFQTWIKFNLSKDK